jgi:hypothetical protein
LILDHRDLVLDGHDLIVYLPQRVGCGEDVLGEVRTVDHGELRRGGRSVSQGQSERRDDGQHHLQMTGIHG